MEKQVEKLYQGFDFYNVDMHFTDKQKETRQLVRDYVEMDVMPNINPYWEIGFHMVSCRSGIILWQLASR